MILTAVLLLSLALQGWAIGLAWRGRTMSAIPVTLGVAAAVLAARGALALAGVQSADLLGEISILVVSAALVAALRPRPRPVAGGPTIEGEAAAFLDNSPIPAMIKDADGRYLYVNAAFERMFERPRSAVIGRTTNELWTPELVDISLSSDAKIIASGEPVTHETPFHYADGSRRDWLVTKFRLPMPDGTRRIACIYADVTEQRASERQLAESEARMTTLLDSSPTLIYFKDRSLRFIMCNKRYWEAYGIDPDSVVGKTSLELHGDEFGRGFLAHDEEVLERREMISREETIRGRTFLTTKFPVIDRDGNLLGVGGVETDITERVEVELAYRTARDEAEAANRAKSAFLANMSHELRTPLNSIIGFSDSLKAETLGPLANRRQSEYLDHIKAAGEHLLEVINDILDLSRIEAGKLKLEEADINVQTLVSDAVALTAGRAEASHLTVTVDIPKDLPRIYADERQMKQVLINLLTNAVKFTPAGGRVTVGAAAASDGGLDLVVADSGVGISAADLERVQQPFVQIAGAMTRKHEGSGLGLAIVKSIVALHGGEVTLESTLGEGTTCIVHLPASRVVPHGVG